MNEYFEKLAQALNALPQGFPRTESNVELEILQLMFTPQEARMAALMNDSWDTVAVAAQKAGLPSLEATRSHPDDGTERFDPLLERPW